MTYNPSFYQLRQLGYFILQEISKLDNARTLYRLGKPLLSGGEQRDLKELENAFGSLDFLSQSRNAFTEWNAKCDFELSNYKRTQQVRNFEREKRGVQKLFEKMKPDYTILVTKMKNTLYALEIVEKTAVKKEVRLEEKIPSGAIEVITVEKSQPFTTMKRIEAIFQSASGYVKILDKYIGEHSLDFVWKVPSHIPVKILTSIVEEKTKRTFEAGYKRLQKERLAKVEVRICKPSEFHDRYIITQNELWHSGPSLKDLGITKWGTVSKIGNSQTKLDIENRFQEIWKTSNELKF